MATYTRFPNGTSRSRFARSHGAAPDTAAAGVGDAPAETDAATAADTRDSVHRPGRTARTRPAAGVAFRRPPARRDGASVPAEDPGAAAPGTPPGGALSAPEDASAKTRKRLLSLFIVTLLIPLMIDLGPLLLNPHRIFLLVAFVPLFFMWISGRAGRPHATDFLFAGYVVWMAVSIFAAHGFSRIQLIGINTVEAFGAYLVGRVLVRGPQEYDRVLRALTLVMLVFLPAAIVESNAGIRIFSRLADAIGQTYTWVHSLPYYTKRLGMYRAQMVFEHPILFGVFASTTFSLLYFRVRPDGRIYGFRTAMLSLGNTFFALSSGPLLSLVTQIGVVSWDKIMRGLRNHWKLLIGLVVFGYVFVDLLSNRTPFEVFISYATFNAANGYMRINIFNAGIQNVWANPIFGLGMRDWVRPSWIPPSVDNFWLLMAMRHGIPGFFFIAGVMLTTIVGLGRRVISDPAVAAMRKGAVVAFVGLTVALATVHVWGPTYAFVCFLFGATSWMRGYGPGAASQRPRPGAPDRTARHAERAGNGSDGNNARHST